MTGVTTRVCRFCLKEKPLDELERNPSCLYGHAPRCRKCVYARRKGRVLNPSDYTDLRYISNEFTIATLERFCKKFKQNEATGCWDWTGYLRTGYGNLYHKDASYQAHRLIYEAVKGKIPEGLQIDHLCRNRACVNPKHLEAVTQQENIKRATPYYKKKRDRRKYLVPVRMQKLREAYERGYADGFRTNKKTILSELLGELPEEYTGWSNFGKRDLTDKEEGFNNCLKQVVSVIQTKIGELNG